ncbi:dimethylsulfoniopropionate demethylase [Sulfitobacter mediterraneus]|uniref:dimethylsulfoniopropionate demethylase n=1 Tax=Sulfitobacter mediterraneus TaxID=83219 RepID=UPI001933C235|nr:dimethylsulfoniopropionate demethylase [Sulfitobacter mediterraneus]MBM1309058.1 dimethylsulfoniopropionate demethylase [Sulfitobacter mediterraneus]MBM1312942.1 dimethylsulfoniopropionate demethylase [Sulfitobacter mediterraneus]MBM1321325.1 dimethylsulfoniopropionate demethylase [Sulfitobacter mediterraneus]MBM1325212.1 dimethylsulfoniopropionate demethylase [Sulfitobacter mediterraneus]MBM1396559.1 dimethylsulfoniopropionate demethylase [Sulfitobacter mediterraneus]
MALISPSGRLRRTPFSDGVEAAGVKAYTVYNRMLLPTVFESVEADYHHLKKAVQIWDVSCERQVELRGPDAAHLMQLLTPRPLAKMQVGQCYYVPIVDEAGGMLNDPVAVKLAEDRWWISIADSDLLLWVKGVAYGRDLDVTIEEPDVSPLGVQGPLADDLMARVFGKTVRDVRFFRFGRFDFQGRSLVVARSGYSKQGGFEIYLEGSDLGMPLWTALMEAGQDLNVRAGCPNLIERIEGGLLSYGNDMTRANTPFECGLDRFCKLGPEANCIGHSALQACAEEGPVQQIRAMEIAGDAVPGCDRLWPLFDDGRQVGHVSSAVWSPDYQTNVAVAMVRKDHWEPGTRLQVQTPVGKRGAVVREGFWA